MRRVAKLSQDHRDFLVGRVLAVAGLALYDRSARLAAGHGATETPRSLRPKNPGGLSNREVDVLQLAARGLTTKEIADRLHIAPKTADHHIQHIYDKIGVSTRAVAALWAMQHAVVAPARPAAT